MNRSVWLALLLTLAFALPGRGETKYTFKPSVKQGDTFSHESATRTTLKMGMGARTLLEVRRSEAMAYTETIDKLGPGGVIQELTEKTTRDDVTNESVTQGKAVAVPNAEGTLAGVTTRLTRQEGGKYKRTLVEGKANAKVETKLKKTEQFLMGEDALPTRPLAVGESQTIDDPARLAELTELFGENEKFEKPPVVTLDEVKTVDGRKTAFLTERLSINGSLPGPGGTPIPMKVDFDLKLTYDLDRGFLTGYAVTTKGTGTLKQNKTELELNISSDLTDKISRN